MICQMFRGIIAKDGIISIEQFLLISLPFYFRLPKINKGNIRVLIFRDCDKNGKYLILDSDAVAEVKEDEVNLFPVLNDTLSTNSLL